MANPYSYMGDPQHVDLVEHDHESKEPIYSIRMVRALAIITMISPPSTADLFHPTDDEAVEEQDMDAEDLLYQACDRTTIPTNPRAREVFGFDICQSEQQASCLLEAYRMVKNKGSHQKILRSWRTKATLEAHVGAIVQAPSSTHGQPSMHAHDPLQALPILRVLDQDMQKTATSWTKYERLLRSKMKEYPNCINSGAVHGPCRPGESADTPSLRKMQESPLLQ
ncbi:hypothetical protein EDD36DRAFT_464248 [Exophiala viscosa]|uniref:Uncharacterized protein n=1 Tax=Exophiala viscosa TaxID=2486360 RepID=A0AAN6DXH9_9EURO|nr:hypothetical protein EDD36DRAFT_464248 [Exophiala viscosa]